jgi:hypothetical protein
MTDKNRTRKTPEELLSVEDLHLLSGNAARLYAAIWDVMDVKQLRQVYISDGDLAMRLKLPLRDLNLAQRELQNALFFEMKFGNMFAVYSLIEPTNTH